MSKNKMGRPVGIKYKHHITVRFDEYSLNWIEHIRKQIGVTTTEVIRRVIMERAANDPSYKAKREIKGVL